jgi:phosphoribosylglycinamide formyltransferase-1
MKRIAILASGTGTNAERIIRHLAGNSEVQVTLVLSNNPDAAVLQKAECLGVQTKVFTKAELNITGEVLHLLKDNHIDVVVLAGFLLLFQMIWCRPTATASSTSILHYCPSMAAKACMACMCTAL